MNVARAAFVALLLCFSCAAAADVAVPPLSGRVIDQTGTLSSGEVAALTQTLSDLEKRKGSQIAVLIVPTTDQESIEQFSIRVAEAWKIGRKKIDDGALLVVAKNDRRLRIEVGYGLEGALTDATARRIIDEDITPKFKSGDFAGGISAGVDRIIRVIDGEKLPAPAPEHWRSPGLLNNIDPFNPFVIAALFIAGGILRSTLGRLFGSLATGGFVGLLAWFLVGSLGLSVIFAIIAFVLTMFGESIASAGGRGGTWSGGSGGSSSGGGFSGGGGSFGGGGASGRW
ncbi:YgcG family protein [Bradyrhizobium sp.]|uniref:TPM domain-containing protein n=1 Tax=Bradyrhizobium sp. TaxID=376 RepID=UPI0027354951|nr:YgcG family protein [Bradyrhizobium sp.]MDP3074950.1 YgcG family protein [Bradyrhizobium sp.]